MREPRPIDSPLPHSGTGRTVEVQTIVISPIPLVEARQRFLSGLRFKTSRVSNRRLTAGTAEKYRHWLNRRAEPRLRMTSSIGSIAPRESPLFVREISSPVGQSGRV